MEPVGVPRTRFEVEDMLEAFLDSLSLRPDFEGAERVFARHYLFDCRAYEKPENLDRYRLAIMREIKKLRGSWKKVDGVLTGRAGGYEFSQTEAGEWSFTQPHR